MRLFEETYYPWIIVIVGLIIFGSHLGVLPINIMEARNFVTAREMILDGHWILTTMNDAPRYEKPPLPTWLTAFSAMMFGIKNVAALRLPAVIITIALLLGVYTFSFKRLKFSKTQAFNGVLILATSFYMLFSGRNGQWDIFTHGFMIFGIYYFFLLFESQEKTYRNALLSGLFIGLSFMSKGPVSLFALFLPFVIAYGIIYEFKSFKSKIIPLLILILITIVLSAWWPYYIYLFDGNEAQRIADKEANAWVNRNVRPFYYYWSFFTQSGIWTLPAFMGLLYPYMKPRVEDLKGYQFTLLWTLIIVILLSVIPEKKSRYLLPVLIPLALNTSYYIKYLIDRFKELQNKERIPVYFNFGLIGLIAIAVPVLLFIQFKSVFEISLIWSVSASLVIPIIGILIFRALFRQNIQKVFYLTIAFVCAVMLLLLPLSSVVNTNKKYEEISALNTLAKKEKVKVYDLMNSAPELIWSYGEPLPIVYKTVDFVDYPEEERFGLIVQQSSRDVFKDLFKDYNYELISEYNHNLSNEGKRGYKHRLTRDFYILTKKK